MEETPTVSLRHALYHQRSTTEPNFDTSLDYFGLNVSNSSAEDVRSPGEQTDTRGVLYTYIVSFLVLFCLISILVNIWILSSVYWIRRKLSRTLLISLSLAGADVFSSVTLGLGLVVNSLMDIVLGIKVNDCVALVLEAFRLSAVITTVVHLLALAGNHYLGILRPLHYASIMTHRMTTLCIVLLWLFPLVFIFSYFSLLDQQGFTSPNCAYDFLKYSKFRVVFATLFFVPFLVMLVIYSHIFIIVRRHQSAREVLIRDGTIRVHHNHRLNSMSRNSHPSGGTEQSRHQQMARNVKAIYTTMFILGSFVIGWMPALLVFLMVCHDCRYRLDSGNRLVMIGIHSFTNFLVILKTLLNPIIYAARMHEIKVAMRRMHCSIRRVCCPCLPAASNGGAMETSQSELSRHLTQRTSAFNCSTRASGAVLCRVQSYPPTDTPLTSSNGSFEDVRLSLLQRSTRRSQSRRREVQSVVL